MKRYIKILMITLGIQLGSLIIAMLLANMFRMQGNLALLGTVLLLISFPISIVVDIVLSIKWGASLAEKLIYIFFMPTNYTLFIFILFANSLHLAHILKNILIWGNSIYSTTQFFNFFLWNSI